MSRIINEKGLLFLTRVVLNLSENLGTNKAVEVIKSDPKLYIDLLSEDHFQEVGEKENIQIKKDWSVSDLEELKLTKLQSVILKTILTNKNSLTLDQLEKKLRRKKIEVRSGSMIGGSLAGISKKCESNKMPSIYKSVHGSEGITYSIIPEAEETLKSFLN